MHGKKLKKISLIFSMFTLALFKFFIPDAFPVTIIPYPQELSSKNFSLILNDKWDIFVDSSTEKDFFAAMEFQKELKDKYNLSISIKHIVPATGIRSIILSKRVLNNDVKSVCLERNLIPDIQLGEEGYLLEVFCDNVVIITANDSSGVFYGVQTLKQILSDKNDKVELEAVRVKDWPKCGIRGIHIQTIHERNIGDVEEIVQKIAFLKMNMILIDSDYWYQKKKYPQLLNLVEYCRRRHVEPVPELQSFGVAKIIFSIDPHTAEGVWVEDEPFKFVDNIAIPVIPEAVPIKNPGFEIDKDGDKIPDNWQFYIEPPEISQNYWLLDNAIFHSGSYSVKVRAKGTSNPLVQACKVEPNTVYNVSFYAKKTAGSTSGYSIAMRISQWDKDSKFIVENYIPVKTTAIGNWEEHDLNFITQPKCSFVHISASISNGEGVAWFDDIELKRINGSLINVIRTETSDVTVTNLDKTVTYQEGIDYNITDGCMEYPYDVTNAPAKINRIENGSILDGERVLVSYDFVVRFYPSIRKIPSSPSEPKTYHIIFAALKDVIQVFKPKYICIGHDEIYGMNRDSRSRRRNLTNAYLLAEDVIKLNNYIHSLNPEIKVMMWDDMINSWHYGGRENFQMLFGGQSGITSEAIDLIPKDVLPIVWWYSASDYLSKMKNSSNYFKSKGFNYLVAGWNEEKNIKDWIEIIKDEEESRGIIITNWLGWQKNLENIKIGATCGWTNDME
ncbi:MAG: hypothetical protein KAQ99_10140 [Candidatus Aureabacteria bacterium]|nr:hypothetical protein [Candidatus Auribacterota bacterium]MCK5161922.1 hypothetical protein [Candidatus Auribacterota bacterium]